MYSIDSAYGVTRTQGAQWQDHDGGALTAVEVYSTFRQLYLTLSSQFLAEPIFVDFTSLQPSLGTDTRTLEEIFTDWSNETPPTVDEIPEYETVRAVFTDAVRAGYKLQVARPGSHWTSSATPQERTEVQISRPGTNMEYFVKRCMVSINGYFYPIETDGVLTFVPNAGKNSYATRRNQCGILSFEKVGELTQVPIVPANVRPAAVGGQLRYRCHIDLPEIDLTNKSVILVMAGHIHFIGDGVFWPVSNNTFCVDMEKIPTMERFYESRKFLDYSKMNLVDWIDKEVVNIEDFYSDAKFMHYIAHEQSYFVVVDTPRLTKAKMHIRGFQMPGLFITYKEPNELLVTGTGRVAEYWKVHEDGEWRVTVADSYRANRVFSSTPTDNPNAVVSSNNLPYRTYFNSRAHLLDIIGDKLKTP